MQGRYYVGPSMNKDEYIEFINSTSLYRLDFGSPLVKLELERPIEYEQNNHELLIHDPCGDELYFYYGSYLVEKEKYFNGYIPETNTFNTYAYYESSLKSDILFNEDGTYSFSIDDIYEKGKRNTTNGIYQRVSNIIILCSENKKLGTTNVKAYLIFNNTLYFSFYIEQTIFEPLYKASKLAISQFENQLQAKKKEQLYSAQDNIYSALEKIESKKYVKYCPFCLEKKLRYATANDKYSQIGFFDIFSDKKYAKYYCDNCGKLAY